MSVNFTLQEKERRRREVEFAPRRTSSRLLSKKKGREEAVSINNSFGGFYLHCKHTAQIPVLLHEILLGQEADSFVFRYV